jgi:hypothetical protein
MPRGLEVIVSQVTAPSSTLTAATANTGNSLAIRNADVNSKIWLIAAWGFNQVAGTQRIRSPRLHDNVQGIRYRVTAASVLPLWPGSAEFGFKQFLIAQDTLVVEITGSAVGGQIEENAMLIYYDSLPGVAARLITNDDLTKNGVNLVTAEVSVTAVATGQWGGAVAINSSFDTLKANTDYAIVGGLTDTRGTAVRIAGIDTGNLGVGFPAEPSIRQVTANWFQRLSAALGLPLIPVVNAANKAAINIDVATNQAGGTYICTLNLVEMVPGSVPGAAGTKPAGT